MQDVPRRTALVIRFLVVSPVALTYLELIILSLASHPERQLRHRRSTPFSVTNLARPIRQATIILFLGQFRALPTRRDSIIHLPAVALDGKTSQVRAILSLENRLVVRIWTDRQILSLAMSRDETIHQAIQMLSS